MLAQAIWAIHGGALSSERFLMRYVSFNVVAAFLLSAAVIGFGAAARADENQPATYAKFTEGLTPQHGLFTVWRGKDGKVALELSPSQLDHDYILSAVPANGLGGYFMIAGGGDYYAPHIVRFERYDNAVAIVYPNTDFMAPRGSPAANAIADQTARSVVGIAKIVAEDAKTGDIVIDASALLGDVIDLADALKLALGEPEPSKLYRLDSQHSYFGPTKSFPENTLIDVRQTWNADDATIVDNVPDPRAIEFKVDYNFIEPPNDSDYMPRLADDRVGYFSTVRLDFGTDKNISRQTRYIVRWNLQKTDPSKQVSPAKHPMVFFMSNTVPQRYRDAIRRGVLEWNKAFLPLGITDAVQVKDQPNDPSWDADDVRYSVLRWLTESNSGGFAEAQLYADPRTGQEFRTGIVFDADLVQFAYYEKTFFIDPAAASFSARERMGMAEAHNNAAFAAVAMRALGEWPGDQVPQSFIDDFMIEVTLHETGHDVGLQHNFIASQGYTLEQLRSKSFTATHGTATSVMHYIPTNIWPKGKSQGALFQTVLGPYDYYAIHWGYAPVPGARTPQDEVPTLSRWASTWSDPWHRFASDEDVDWASGHAVDPRVMQFGLSNNTIRWCDMQMNIARAVANRLDARFPLSGHPFEDERTAFQLVLAEYRSCARMAANYIGGEFLSRGHVGDPGNAIPLAPIPRAQEVHAWQTLDAHVFSDRAFAISPATLNRLTYQEFAPFTGGAWAYDPPNRHDLPLAQIIAGLQYGVLASLFSPLRLQRIDELVLRSRPGSTMTIGDLFNWAQESIYGDLRAKNLATVPLLTRNLQAAYTRMLIAMALTPARGTPSDAQALARAKLVSLSGTLRQALNSGSLDEVSRAHLELLQNRVGLALEGRIPGRT